MQICKYDMVSFENKLRGRSRVVFFCEISFHRCQTCPFSEFLNSRNLMDQNSRRLRIIYLIIINYIFIEIP